MFSSRVQSRTIIRFKYLQFFMRCISTTVINIHHGFTVIYYRPPLSFTNEINNLIIPNNYKIYIYVRACVRMNKKRTVVVLRLVKPLSPPPSSSSSIKYLYKVLVNKVKYNYYKQKFVYNQNYYDLSFIFFLWKTRKFVFFLIYHYFDLWNYCINITNDNQSIL